MDIQRMPVYGTHMFVAYQTVGAYFVLAAYLLYVARPHLKKVVRTAFWKEEDDSSDELMPYRVAFWGLVLSFGLIMAWSVLAGMSLWLALLEFGVFLFVIALVMTRSTAEAGMLMTETTFRPIDLYSMFAPVSAVGPANITMLALFDTMFLREQRGLLLTGIMDGLKMSDGVKVKRRSFLSVFVVGIITALLIAGYLHMVLPYSKGGITMYEAVYRGHNIGPLQHYEGQFSNTNPPTWQSYTFFAVGVAFAAFLTYMRAMFYWWPLARIYKPLWYISALLFTASTFLNVTSHKRGDYMTSQTKKYIHYQDSPSGGST
jgi:type IV secretory pathway TrbD component